MNLGPDADWPDINKDIHSIWGLIPDAESNKRQAGQADRPLDDLFSRLTIKGRPGFHAAFDVDRATMASTSAAALAIAELGSERGAPSSEITIDSQIAAAQFMGHLLVNGQSPPKWADLSGYYQTGDDRQIQFHCNFPHHAAGVVDLLGGDPDRSAIEAQVADWEAEHLETVLLERGLIAAKLRTISEWDGHPHAIATRSLPLLAMEKIGEADPRDLTPTSETTQAASWMSGLRVLDCSRVLAGPSAGQTLAAHGADVLRLDSPNLPSVELCLQLTGSGKRNASLDLDTETGRDTMSKLLSNSDVWIDAYRPDALANKGFSDDYAAKLNPGIVVVQLSAFDWTGPWTGRRGFDSIVQSTTGIVAANSKMAEMSAPGARTKHRDHNVESALQMPAQTTLPVQLLDYATGQLAAFAAAKALTHQSRYGGSWRVRLSLLRTRNWLTSMGGPSPFIPSTPVASPSAVRNVETDWGFLELARPVTGAWATPPSLLGTAATNWPKPGADR